MKIKKALIWIVHNPMELIAATSITLAILIAVINAITRYAFRIVWNPSTDVTKLLFAYMVFCGAAAAYRRKMHYGVTIIVDKLPASVQSIVAIIVHILVLAVLVVSVYLSIGLCAGSGGKLMADTNIPYFWFDLSAVIGFGYMAWYELLQTIDEVKKDISQLKAKGVK